MESVVVPLSFLDAGSSSLSLTFAFILDSPTYDTSKLDEAIFRVCNKWRLVAGRLEFVAKAKQWIIRVPTSENLPEGYKTHTFTSGPSHSPGPLELFEDDTADVVDRPPVANFRHPSTPSSSSTYAKRHLPFLSVHCSASSDCTYVGITVPHVCFDGHGIGMIWSFISAELSGTSWVAPPLNTENLLMKALKSAPPSADSAAIGVPANRDWTASTFGSVVKMLGSFAYEFLWHKAELHDMRVGKDVADYLVRRVKEDVATQSGGKEWVSTADVMCGFFLKSAYGGEDSSTNDITVDLMCSLLPLFPTIAGYSDHALAHFPHNSFAPSPLPLFNARGLKDMSIGDLALLHRKAIESSRRVGSVRAYLDWASKLGGPATPVRKWGGTDAWMFVNQSFANLAEGIEWGQGAKTHGAWVVPLPFNPDHMATCNVLRGGYIIMCVMRRSRWEAARRELAKVKAEMLLDSEAERKKAAAGVAVESEPSFM